MNLKQLEVFLSVVQHGSFSAAARETHLTQSTVSQHIAGLERELGVQILERSRNGIRVTDGGKVLLKHARSVAGELRATHLAIRRYRGLEDTTLRLGVSTVPGTYLVPNVLARLCDRFPRLKLVVMQGGSRETVDRIASREVEAGIVGSRFSDPGLLHAAVGQERICLVVPRGHRWAARGSIALDDLYEGEFVSREAGSGTSRTVTETLRTAGVELERLHVRAQLGGNEAVRAAVVAGIGAAFLSEMVVRSHIEQGQLVIVSVDEIEITRPFYLARLSGRELGPAAAEFWSMMQLTFGSAQS